MTDPKTAERLMRRLHAHQRANPPRCAEAAATIEEALALPDAEELFYVAELLEELADCYANLKRYDDAIAAMERALAAGWDGVPDGRASIAEYLLLAGRTEEAGALFGQVKADTPEDPWLYNNAGAAYALAGDHRRALEWLSEGLDLALRTGDPEGLVSQLSELRRLSLAALGLPPDELEHRADAFLESHPPAADADAALEPEDWDEGPDWDEEPPAVVGTRVAVAWFPPQEFALALQRWPAMVDQRGGDSYTAYVQEIQRFLAEQARAGVKPCLAPLQTATYAQWCTEHNLDAAGGAARARYAAVLEREGQTLAWPPGRNDPCWCGSGRKYKKCCGAG